MGGEDHIWYAAFIGDCRASVQYRLYGEVARAEGYTAAAEWLVRLSEWKQAHARLWLEKMGLLGDTVENLAWAGELVGTERYRAYAAQAETEEMAARLQLVAQCEEEMEKRLLDQLAQIELRRVPEGEKLVCCRCGYPYRGTKMPQMCPMCRAENSFTTQGFPIHRFPIP